MEFCSRRRRRSKQPCSPPPPPPSRRAFRAGDWVLTKSRPVPLEDDADDHSQGECK